MDRIIAVTGEPHAVVDGDCVRVVAWAIDEMTIRHVPRPVVLGHGVLPFAAPDEWRIHEAGSDCSAMMNQASRSRRDKPVLRTWKDDTR